MLFSKIEKHINNTTKIFSFASAFIGALATLFIVYGFYYKAKETVENHGEEIIVIKKDVKEIKEKINTSDVIYSGSTAEFKALKEKVERVEKTADRIEDKLDQVLIQNK